MKKHLFPWAQREADEFFEEYGSGNCSCHVRAPCGSCTHPGNPFNLECTEDAWGTESEVLLAYAESELPEIIEKIAARHVAEMKASWRQRDHAMTHAIITKAEGCIEATRQS